VRANARVVLACACLLGLFTPTPAYALFGSGWLERLSGPGPFKGWVFNDRFLCLTVPRKGDDRDLQEWARKLTYPREEGKRAYLSLVGCNFLPSDDPRLEIGVQGGWLKSTDNVLDYNGLGLSDDDKEVKLTQWMITADIRVNRVLDVGAAIGRARFRPGGVDLFDDFSRTVTQPLRLTTRPLAALSNDKRLEALVVRFDATKFHGGFTDADFGARPGTFNEPGEILWNWAILVDPFALLWKRDKP
jgi:hypothetical protein